MKRLLFPDPPRELPGRRFIKIIARAAHVLCAGVLLGAFVFSAASDARDPWLIATVLSGLFIVALDLHESAAFLCQVRGLIVAGKIAVVALLPAFGDATAQVLGAVVILSVISSHAPAGFRYRLLIGGGNIRGADSKG